MMLSKLGLRIPDLVPDHPWAEEERDSERGQGRSYLVQNEAWRSARKYRAYPPARGRHEGDVKTRRCAIRMLSSGRSTSCMIINISIRIV